MTIESRYDSRCTDCGCFIKAGSLVQWQRGVQGVRHVTTLACENAKRARAAELAARPVTTSDVVANGQPIAAFIQAARDRGLKFPKCRFLAADGRSELRLSLSGEKSAVPNSIQVKIGDEWIGRIEPSGRVVGRLSRDVATLATLNAIAANPVAAATAYGALMCRCSFCDKSLEAEGSTDVGYGPVCAKKWGLPHSGKATKRLTARVPVADEREQESAYDVDPLLAGPAFEEAVA